MTTKYIFHNFTTKPFTGYWNGKAYTFKPGVKKYYIKGIAENFAKHLANQVLTENGKETFTSPKKPNEVPVFMEVFNKALLTEEVLAGHHPPGCLGMNIKVAPRAPIDPYDAHSQPATGPGSAPQIIGEASEEEDGYEEPKGDGEAKTA